MQPNNPGYDLASADLQRARISSEDLARIVVRATGGNPSNAAGVPVASDPVVSLLAQIALTQKRSNAKYAPLGFTLAAYTRYQILTENPLRTQLLIQNVGSGDLMVLFGTGDVTPTVIASDQLLAQQAYAIRIVAGGSFEPYVSPTNPITLFTLATGTLGVCIEGA